MSVVLDIAGNVKGSVGRAWMGNTASTFSARINAAVAERANVSQSLYASYDHSQTSTAHYCSAPFSVLLKFKL